MGADAWFCADGQQKLGPFSLEQLRRRVAEGQLLPADMIWQEGAERWVTAGSVGELFPATAPLQPAATSEGLPRRYWLFADGRPQGPYDAEQIRSWLELGQPLPDSGQVVTGDLLACPEGGSRWSLLSRAAEFRDAPPRRPGQAEAGDGNSEPHPAPTEVGSHPQSVRQGSSQGSKLGGASGFSTGVVGGILVALGYSSARGWGWREDPVFLISLWMLCPTLGAYAGKFLGSVVGYACGLGASLTGLTPETASKFTRTVVIVVILLASASWFGTVARDTDYQAIIREGNRLTSAGDAAGALRAFTRAIASEPCRPEAYFLRGVVYHRDTKDPEAAQADYTEAIRLGLKDGGAVRYNRGLCYAARNDQEHAIADFTEAIRSGNTAAAVYLNRGLCFAKRKDHDRAIADFTQAIRLDPRTGHLARAAVHLERKDHDRAIADLTEAIRLDGQNAVAYSQRGDAHFDKKDYDIALKDYTEAIRLGLGDRAVYFNRGLCCSNLKDYDRAVADFTEAIRLDGTDAGAYFQRGFAYGRKRDHERAITDYTEAIRYNPNDALAYFNRGLHYEDLGDRVRARADRDTAARLDPKLGK